MKAQSAQTFYNLLRTNFIQILYKIMNRTQKINQIIALLKSIPSKNCI